MRERSPYEQWVGLSVGPYRLDELVGESELGPIFAARDTTNGTTFLLRILPVVAAESAGQVNAYRTEVQRFATKVGALRHPYMLPLVDYGLYQGLPYLVWPHLVMRSLTARVTQSGPADVVTVGRYVDQIAAALEAAHQQALLHRNLSTDNIFIQLDGHLVVADFGVRRLMELLGTAERTLPFYGSQEACAPEQISGGQADTSTDVYALAGVTYRLLTGYPVFPADSAESLLRQHAYAQPPSLSVWRRGLPADLDGVLAAALAKEQAARTRHPGAFANAYHAIIAPYSMTRVPFAEAEPPASSSQTSRAAEAALPAQAPHVTAISEGEAVGALPGGGSSTGRAEIHGAGRRSATGGSRGARRLARDGLFVSVLVVLVLVSGGLFLAFRGQGGGAVAQPGGTVAFVDSTHGPSGHTDALHIVMRGVAAPPSGSVYVAWFVDAQSESVSPIGTLTRQGQTYALDYQGDAANGQPGANLLTQGAEIEITQEQSAGKVPLGTVVMTASFPPQALVHIQHLLVSFPTTPGKIGLLVGTLTQTQELDAQAAALQNAAASGNTAAVQCSAQSMLDIIEGARGTHYRPLSSACADLNITLTGDGYGLLAPPSAGAGKPAYSDAGGYLDGASDHAALAAAAPDATAQIQLHAGHVEVALSNIKGWVTTADHDALRLLTTPTDASAVSDLVAVCDHAYHGVPGNPDETIHPVPGQAGAVTAYEHGQFMATLSLVPAH